MIEIEKHGEKSKFCEPGDNVKIKVGGVDDWEQIESGFMLCPVKNPIPHSTTIDAEVSCSCDNLEHIGELARALDCTCLRLASPCSNMSAALNHRG